MVIFHSYVNVYQAGYIIFCHELGFCWDHWNMWTNWKLSIYFWTGYLRGCQCFGGFLYIEKPRMGHPSARNWRQIYGKKNIFTSKSSINEPFSTVMWVYRRVSFRTGPTFGFMVHLEQCETPLLMFSSWMFLDSTHQFDEIWGISSLTNSHQFLDVLGFYSPIWWNLRNINFHQFSPILGCSWILLTNLMKIEEYINFHPFSPIHTNSHQFSPGLSQSTGKSPSKPAGRTWTVGNLLVRRPGKNPPKAWTWCSLAKNRGVLVFCWAFFVFRFCFFGCFMCIRVFCQYEDTHVTPLLSRTFETSLHWKWPLGGYIHGINHSFSNKTRVEIRPMNLLRHHYQVYLATSVDGANRQAATWFCWAETVMW